MLDQPSRPKRRRRPPAHEITPSTPIWCPWCQADHPASDFNKETRRFSGLSGICRKAWVEKRKDPEAQAKWAAYQKKRWVDPEYRAASLEWQRNRRRSRGANADLKRARARLQRIVDEWKAQGCTDCGYDDIRAIDPDHRDPEEKVGHLSRMVTMCAAADRIRTELAKCDPRCARCHRRRTHKQRFSKNRLADRVPPSWQRRIDMQDENDLIKLERGCADCTWREWARGLDWDHVRGPKVATIAMLIAKISAWDEVLAEMAKCEVVCANCHRIRTCERRKSDLNSPEADSVEGW